MTAWHIASSHRSHRDIIIPYSRPTHSTTHPPRLTESALCCITLCR